MSDETSMAQKFDRWWAEYKENSLKSDPYSIVGLAKRAFMAGAAAERAEHREAARRFAADTAIRPANLPPDDDKYDEELFR